MISSEVAAKMSAGTAVVCSLDWQKLTHIAWQGSAGLWQEAIVPHHVNFFMGYLDVLIMWTSLLGCLCILITWQLESPAMSDPRESKMGTAVS